MMNDVKIFEFEKHDVETVFLDGEILFNPYDVGDCLKISKSTVLDHISKMDENERILITNSDMDSIDIRKFNNRGEVFLREPGLYLLIFKSNKPEAQKFKKWIANEVLPSLRKTGSYQLESAIHQQLETTLHGLKILTGIEPEEMAIKQNESWRAKLSNLINDTAKREQISTNSLYEKLYFLFASETGFHIPELAKADGVSNSTYLKNHELSAKMLYEFALAYFYKDKRFVELISLNPDQKTLGDFKGGV